MNTRSTDRATPDTAGAAGRAHITIRGLSKRFGGHQLYTAFDLDIPRAQITSVFGPNGCGKSTMINMVAGLVPMDAGTVLFDGKPIEATLIGYVFQLDKPESFAPGVTSKDIASEIDLYLDWKINSNFIASFVGAFADPQEAARQGYGRTDTFTYGMAYLAYSY